VRLRRQGLRRGGRIINSLISGAISDVFLVHFVSDVEPVKRIIYAPSWKRNVGGQCSIPAPSAISILGDDIPLPFSIDIPFIICIPVISNFYAFAFILLPSPDTTCENGHACPSPHHNVKISRSIAAAAAAAAAVANPTRRLHNCARNDRHRLVEVYRFNESVLSVLTISNNINVEGRGNAAGWHTW